MAVAAVAVINFLTFAVIDNNNNGSSGMCESLHTDTTIVIIIMGALQIAWQIVHYILYIDRMINWKFKTATIQMPCN